MFNNDRCLLYNKAFYEAFLNPEHTPVFMILKSSKDLILIRDWATTKRYSRQGNSHTQYVKLMEEAGELARALLKKDRTEI